MSRWALVWGFGFAIAGAILGWLWVTEGAFVNAILLLFVLLGVFAVRGLFAIVLVHRGGWLGTMLDWTALHLAALLAAWLTDAAGAVEMFWNFMVLWFCGMVLVTWLYLVTKAVAT